MVTLALGLATAEAITNVTNLVPDLRWPNDVLIHQRKCAGILVQLNDGILISGIGINVNHTAFPAELAYCDLIAYRFGREYDRESLLMALIGAIDEHLENLTRNGKEAVLRAFSAASSYVRGRRVVVEQNGQELAGVTDGLDPQGFLLLRKDDVLARLSLPEVSGRHDTRARRWKLEYHYRSFRRSALRRHWRLRTVHDQTADEWGILLRNLFFLGDLSLDEVDGIIIASVVPPLDSTLAAMSRAVLQ